MRLAERCEWMPVQVIEAKMVSSLNARLWRTTQGRMGEFELELDR